MERKIGEIFEFGGEWYQCLKSASCDECAFLNSNCIDNPSLKCSVDDRTDNCSVIFKKLEKVGEPYITFVDKTVQNYLLETAVSVPPKDVFTLINNEQRLIAIEIKQTKEDMEEKKVQHYDCFFDREPSKSNLKPFDLEAAKAGKPVCTRDGRKARIICFDFRDVEEICCLIVAVAHGEAEKIYYYDSCGNYRGGDSSKYDLMMLPEEKPKYEFKPFDRVLARNASFHQWGARFFDRMFEGDYACTDSLVYKQCIPYNEQTAHLLGTTDNFEDNK